MTSFNDAIVKIPVAYLGSCAYGISLPSLVPEGQCDYLEIAHIGRFVSNNGNWVSKDAVYVPHSDELEIIRQRFGDSIDSLLEKPINIKNLDREMFFVDRDVRVCLDEVDNETFQRIQSHKGFSFNFRLETYDKYYDKNVERRKQLITQNALENAKLLCMIGGMDLVRSLAMMNYKEVYLNFGSQSYPLFGYSLSGLFHVSAYILNK